MALASALNLTGLDASKPSAAIEGRLYFATDTLKVFYDTGSAWTPYSFSAGALNVTTKGDLQGFSTVTARIPVGANGEVLTADSTQTLGVKWAAAGGGALTNNYQHLGADVTMTSANTFYDGLTYTPAAGVWEIEGRATVQAGGLQNITVQIWDGTTHYDSAEFTASANGYVVPISLKVVVTASGSQTFKLSAASSGTGSTILAAANQNGVGNNATMLSCTKIG